MSSTKQQVQGFAALIPARLASSRLPNKALALIGELPMVVHVAHRAKEAGAQRVVVATDSEIIADAVRQHGIEAVMTSVHHQSGTERLAEAAQHLQLGAEEVIVNVQGDEPFIPPSLIRAVAVELIRQPDCVMSTAAHTIDLATDYFNPNVVKLIRNARGHAMAFSRAPLPYSRDFNDLLRQAGQHGMPLSVQAFGGDKANFPLRHIGIYAYRNAFLQTYCKLTPSPLESIEALEQLRVLHHGHSIAVTITEHAPAAGVDTAEDLERVRREFRSTGLN